jgi:hypothetical protein
MIIEKPIGATAASAVTNKTNFEWFIDTPRSLIPHISVHPICDYFFLISALYLPPSPSSTPPQFTIVFLFFFLFPPYPGKDVLLTFISYTCNNHLEHERKTLLCFRHFHNAFSFEKSRYIPYAFDLDLGVENVVGYNISYTVRAAVFHMYRV